MLVAVVALSIATLVLMVLFISACVMLFRMSEDMGKKNKDLNEVIASYNELRKAYDVLQPGTDQLIEMYNAKEVEVTKQAELIKSQYDLMQEQEDKVVTMAAQLEEKEQYIKKLSRMKVN